MTKQPIRPPHKIIQIDKRTGKIQVPSLLLMTRTFRKLGKVNNIDNWNISLTANGMDEISFDVHKYRNGVRCTVWEDLIDLKVIEVMGFGTFEISVNYTDQTETIKSIHGISLETELAQIMLYDFHVNDEQAVKIETAEISETTDSETEFQPTVLCNPEDPDHSLLHLVLKDKAMHWSIGYVTPYVALDESSRPERTSQFQRTYTADQSSIYDFLTQTVAKESNVVFLFDTMERKIHCYSLCDCIDPTDGTIKAKGIGEDTSVFVSKRRLANEVTLSSGKDNVKNCIRVEGGDDMMNAMLHVVNMGNSNEIYQFAKFQYDDMSRRLKEKLEDYQVLMDSEETKQAYYGYGKIEEFFAGTVDLFISSAEEANAVLNLCQSNDICIEESSSDATHSERIHPDTFPDVPYWHVADNGSHKQLVLSKTAVKPFLSASAAMETMGIYPRLCKAYEDVLYYESSMMPGTQELKEAGSAKEQYRKLAEALTNKNFYIAVSSVNTFDDNAFLGVTNNIEAYAQILLDFRFDLFIEKGSASYSKNKKTWTGKLRIVQQTDETNAYPADGSFAGPITVKIKEDKDAFAKQKIEKALASGSMRDIDFDTAGIWIDETITDEAKMQRIRNYFNQYALNSLRSFYDGYNSCLSILIKLGHTGDDDTKDGLYQRYYRQMRILHNPEKEDGFPDTGLIEIREEQIARIQERIQMLQKEQAYFRNGGNGYEPHAFRAYIGEEAYLEFCRYRREDTYKNDNYISDGLTTPQCLAKAKELLEAASKEAKKACVLQRTVSASLNNLFALPEFEPLYESFALFNYIRVQTEDEILKLRLIGIECSGDSTGEIQVTFSDQIESLDQTANDLQSILKQASGMASGYSSTILQAKQGADAGKELQDIREHGLNAANIALSESDSKELTITQSGILCRRMDDEGLYGEKQLRITGNTMAFTDNNWKSVKMAIGETTIQDPADPAIETTAYGIIADHLVGKFIASERASIGNKSGSVQITGTGIDITGGSISLKNKRFAIDLDPNHALNDTLRNFLFCIRKTTAAGGAGAPDNVVMGVDTNGNGYFSGNIRAANITNASININDKFIVDPSGNVSLPAGTTVAWDDQYEQHGFLSADNFTEVITAEYISSLHAVAGSVAAEHITGTTLTEKTLADGRIDGGSINGAKILSQSGAHKTQIDAGQIFSTCYNLTEPAAPNSGLLPGIRKLNTGGTAVTNSLLLADHKTEIQKPLTVTNGANDTQLSFPDAAFQAYGSVYAHGTVCPDENGAYSLGQPDLRWSGIYTKNGTVFTSDRNKKHNVRQIEESYEKLFFLLHPVNFMFDGGDRTHIGIIAQDLKESMDALGLSDTQVAAFCRDEKTKWEKDETTGNALRTPELDANGNPQYDYGVRYSEFIMLNTYMIQKLYREKDEMRKEIDSLKQSVALLQKQSHTSCQNETP